MGRLDLLADCAYETGKFESVMDLICQIIKQGQEEASPFQDRALSERDEVRGNGVMTIKQEATDTAEQGAESTESMDTETITQRP